MKVFNFLFVALLLSSVAMANDFDKHYHGGETDSHLLTYEEAEELEQKLDQKHGVLTDFDFLSLFGTKSRFPQTRWNECSGSVRGNYSGYKCSSRRRMSVILKKFLEKHAIGCATKGIRAMGQKGRVKRLSIEHVGISGDPRHSPRSLHSENRAIDVKRFRMNLSTGKAIAATFRGNSRRTFFNRFRKCWGRIVNRYNGCPFYKGQSKLTGSIGKEDRRHRRHMHLSVPYCIRGRYGNGYFKK